MPLVENARDDLIYFFHIPKTAGTSTINFLANLKHPETATTCMIWDHLIQNPELIKHQKIVSGHFGGLLPLMLGRWPKIITMLRDPVARALSHINHVQRTEQHPMFPQAKSLSIREYCGDPLLRKTVENFQSRYLASLGFSLDLLPKMTKQELQSKPLGYFSISFENTLYSLDRSDGLGLCEEFEGSMELFADVVGVPARVEERRLNVADKWQKTVDDLTPSERTALEELNEIDLEAYRHGQELYRCKIREKHAV